MNLTELITMDFNFFNSSECEELHEELKTCDIDDAIDIIEDIIQAKKDFEKNLPDYYHIYWSGCTHPNYERARELYIKELKIR